MVWAIIIILCIAADQLTKAVAESSLKAIDSIPVIDGFFYIVLRVNKGAAWSFLADKSWGIYILSVVSLIASIIMIVMIYKSTNVKLKAALSFICAGAIGNLIDRFFYKGVTDFLDFHFGSYVFPTFNLADSLVVCGTIFLAIVILTDPTILNEKTNDKLPDLNEKTSEKLPDAPNPTADSKEENTEENTKDNTKDNTMDNKEENSIEN